MGNANKKALTKDTRALFKRINAVLADWDPIGGLPRKVALDEYQAYIPLVVRALEDDDSVTECLIEITVNRIGLQHDRADKAQVDDLAATAKKLLHVFKGRGSIRS